MSTQAANWMHKTDGDAPPDGIQWLDGVGGVIDFSDPAWTFGAYLETYGVTTVQKTVADANITGASTSPNIVIDWPAGFFADVPPARYKVMIWADDGGTTKRRYFSLDNPPTVEVQAA